MTWRERFCVAFVGVTLLAFVDLFFTGTEFLEAAAMAAMAGMFFGVLAAVFGKRILDFLGSLPG